MAYELNIGKKGNGLQSLSGEFAPRPVDKGIADGRARTPDVEMLRSSNRLEYLNGYQCGFRERRFGASGWDYPARSDAFLAMYEARYPHYISPPMA